MLYAVAVRVGEDQKRFDELFSLFINDEYRVVQRAAWPVSYCVIGYPGLIKKHWSRLISNLAKPNLHDSVKRNSIRLLKDIDIPKKYPDRLHIVKPADSILLVILYPLVVLQVPGAFLLVKPRLALKIALALFPLLLHFLFLGFCG